MKHLFLTVVLFAFTFPALRTQNEQLEVNKSTSSYIQKDDIGISSSLFKDTKSFVKGAFGNSQKSTSWGIVIGPWSRGNCGVRTVSHYREDGSLIATFIETKKCTSLVDPPNDPY